MSQHPLPERLRKALKKPLGSLIKQDILKSKTTLDEVRSKPIITVGDATTEKILILGIRPILQIIDGKEKRMVRQSPKSEITEIRVINPPGVLTDEGIACVKNALRQRKQLRIFVQGEEDLFTIPALAFAKEGSLVLYGQPDKGLVVVEVNKESKENAIKILLEMGVKSEIFNI